jgi:hypothetical protein
VLAALAAIPGGCALESSFDVHFTGTGPLVVDETSRSVELGPHRAVGVTTRRRAVGIACSVTIVYEANDITPPGVFVQTRVVHLRTRRLPRGTAYDLDCSGPLIVQIPADASGIRATAGEVSLPVRAPVTSVPLAFRKRLRAQRGTQLALVGRPETLPAGDYRIEISFSLSEARPFREKVLYAASVSCGRSSYVEPIVPPVWTMRRVPGLKIAPAAGAAKLTLPRIAGASESGIPVHATRRLSCAR